jgi:transcriptional regulator with XRE-family HTH domain
MSLHHSLCDSTIIAIFEKNNWMEIFEKVRYFRESKKMSQEYISTILNIEQSQFSRRESGQIPFSINELEKLSEIFEIEISEFFKEKTVNFTSNNQSGGSFGYYVSVPDKLIEQYEMRLKEKDEMIKLLKEQIQQLKK